MKANNTIVHALSLLTVSTTPLICIYAANQLFKQAKKPEPNNSSTKTTINHNSNATPAKNNSASWPNYAI